MCRRCGIKKQHDWSHYIDGSSSCDRCHAKCAHDDRDSEKRTCKQCNHLFDIGARKTHTFHEWTGQKSKVDIDNCYVRLNRKVNAALWRGWTPLGPVSATCSTSVSVTRDDHCTNFFFCLTQTLMREIDDKDRYDLTVPWI
jgi:hypothetical protein